jgi:hypothetical protein
MRYGILSLVMSATLATPSVTSATEVPELKKIHVLMVIDTHDKELAPSVKIDERRVRWMLRQTIPSGRYELTTLAGPRATKANILAHYRAHRAGRDDGLVFFYAGHGARDKWSDKAYLNLGKGGPLLRDNLVRAMEAKRTGLVLLMTDCCSSPESYREALIHSRAVTAPPVTKTIHPTVRALLFQARGTINLTAATDNASWGDPEKGGLFTRSVCRMLTTPVRDLDADGDGTVTWAEFFPQLREETESLFGSWRKEMVARGEKVDERKQIPRAFSLGKAGGTLRAGR